MILPKRLNKIAELIEDDVVVIDVGCDHALLDIYLTLNRNNVFCYACDIKESALEIAKKNINKYKLDNKIEVRCCDGISDLEINNNTIIVISGMGKSTIMHILDDDRVYNARRIIIQSNNEIEDLRNDMINKGFCIDNEVVSFDRNKYYVIISFKKGNKKYSNDELYLGPILIKNNKENSDYFKFLLEKEKNILGTIPSKYVDIRKNIEKNIEKIMQLLK